MSLAAVCVVCTAVCKEVDMVGRWVQILDSCRPEFIGSSGVEIQRDKGCGVAADAPRCDSTHQEDLLCFWSSL